MISVFFNNSLLDNPHKIVYNKNMSRLCDSVDDIVHEESPSITEQDSC